MAIRENSVASVLEEVFNFFLPFILILLSVRMGIRTPRLRMVPVNPNQSPRQGWYPGNGYEIFVIPEVSKRQSGRFTVGVHEWAHYFQWAAGNAWPIKASKNMKLQSQIWSMCWGQDLPREHFAYFVEKRWWKLIIHGKDYLYLLKWEEDYNKAVRKHSRIMKRNSKKMERIIRRKYGW